MNPIWYIAFLGTLLVGCDKNDGQSARGPGSGDATAPATIKVGDSVKLSGLLTPAEDIPGDFERRLTARYILITDQNTAIAIDHGSTVSFCETGGRTEGPFFDLEGETPQTTNPYRSELTAVPEADFPGLLVPGRYPLLLTVVGVGDCQYHFEGTVKRRSDIAVLASGEWDPALAGVFQTSLGEGATQSIAFSEPFIMTDTKTDSAGHTVIDVDYDTEIDASVIPGRLTLTVRTVRVRNTGPSLKQGDQRLCIYRSFQDTKGRETLWFSCKNPGEPKFPTSFDYPVRDYKKSD